MKALSPIAAVLGLALAAVLSGAPAAGPVAFRPHDIGPIRGGYAVLAADFNKDGRPDVIANSLSVDELAWYKNPAWQRHVIVSGHPGMVMQAMHDLNGDGVPEVVFEHGFAVQAAKSEGVVLLARSSADPRQPWTIEPIDRFPTSHHIGWADLDGDGRKELINAPLVGPKSVAPTFDQDRASVFWYPEADRWTRRTVTDSVPGIIHRVRPINWDGGRREQILVAGFEGVALYRAVGSGTDMRFEKTLLTPGHVTEPAPRIGASDVGAAQNGRRFFATIEPWHGNEVVIYHEEDRTWGRRVLYDQLAAGHEIVVVDLNGDGRSDVVANDNSRVPAQGAVAAGGRPPNPGVHVFYAPDDPVRGTWIYQRVEIAQAMNGCTAADINGDRHVDLVCTGSGGMIRWYENLGKP